LASEFLLATRSSDKAAEIVDVLRSVGPMRLVTLGDLQIEPTANEDDLENLPTFIQNAVAKAKYFSSVTGRPTLADDSGLMVDALGGAPGVRTKRFAIDHGYAGAGGKQLDEANNDLLLEKLRDVPDEQRTAHYVCAAAVVWPDDTVITTLATCTGRITRERAGSGGFGYDPLFFIDKVGATFAQLDRAQKNARSHRALAFRALASHMR
jgi:XTP/dITP diphosphohydrolase